MSPEPRQIPSVRVQTPDSDSALDSLDPANYSQRTFHLPRRVYTSHHSPSYTRIIRLEGQILSLISILRFHLRYAAYPADTALSALRLGSLPMYFNAIEELVDHIEHGMDCSRVYNAGDLVHLAQKRYFRRVKRQCGAREAEKEGHWPKVLWFAELQRILEDEDLSVGEALRCGWEWFMERDGFPAKYGGVGEWVLGWWELDGEKQEEFCEVFDITGEVLKSMAQNVEGGGRGLGLCMAEGLAEAGGIVHCLDRLPEPPKAFEEAQARLKRNYNSSLVYHNMNVTDEEAMRKCIADIAAENQRLDGLIAAAGVQQVTSALDFKKEDIAKMLEVNYTGVFLAARECARQMLQYKIQGSICLIASMSETIANRGFIAPVYNSSKAAVVQLARNLAMEWGRKNPDGSGGIRVNSLSPGHIVTPMVQANFDAGEANREEWENNSMLGRLSTPEEYKAVGLFMLSKASSYMTGHDLKIDGGTTAW
ncbi:FabG Dehydrogenase with different specificities related to short-chain alcohol dehydrogenase [Pyrenophora tritici-repentis]|nr:FabG Dehydrogenase with different specificities related to short-chain alcohol dehydrogenase [Pyrenophora tritici-repentis]KAI1606739.1 FabG Dehydrogenase with different specificities related to short-chain alcohol dehydrogenase [Pyrenophora tritici-repentis]